LPGWIALAKGTMMDLFTDILERKEFDFDGGKVELARADSSPGYFKRTREAGKIEDEAEKEKAMRAIIGEELIIGWSGLKYKGKPVKFSKKNAVKLMEHGRFRSFVLSVVIGGDFSGEKEIDLELEEAEKN